MKIGKVRYGPKVSEMKIFWQKGGKNNSGSAAKKVGMLRFAKFFFGGLTQKNLSFKVSSSSYLKKLRSGSLLLAIS